MWDWVVVSAYGQTLVVPPLGSLILVMYPVPDFVAGGEEFTFEEASEKSMFLERVTGQILVSRVDTNGPFVWRMMMLGVDYDTVAPLYPGGTADDLFSLSADANLSFWDERCWNPGEDQAPFDIAHPYWTEVDNKPKRKFGAKWNLWPCLVMANRSDTASARVTARLRLGVKG